LTQQEVQFGKYQLLERIATGGMAEIYRARYQAAAGVTKLVVIKKILPHYAGNKNFVSMFINEAKITVGLSHGNIAQVFDFGEIDGEYFIAMEFVHGQALSRVLRKARGTDLPTLPPPVAVAIAMEMCKGLHYAHTRLDERGQPLNIIHRDVSPQNVIVSYEGQVKIVDFGIAKARNATQAETESGAVKGKYVYFSPEQARGRDVDARTDVFATGIVLYEMLCGKLPFEGKMMEVLARVLRGDFPRPRALNPRIPAALERIMLTSMATDKGQRYATAQVFQDALSSYLHSSAPNFSSNALESVMSYLFEKELVVEGIPVKLPPNFLNQLASWQEMPPFAEQDESTRSDKPSSKARMLPALPRSQRPPPAPALTAAEPQSETPAEETDEMPSRAPRGGGPHSGQVYDPVSQISTNKMDPEPSDTLVSSPEPLSVVVDAAQLSASERVTVTRPGGLRRLPRWIFIALPLGALLVSGAAVFLGGPRRATGTLTLDFTPPNAAVFVDGKPRPGTTPMSIPDLSVGTHTVEVRLTGYNAWQKTIYVGTSSHEPMIVNLTPTESPPSASPRP